MGSAYRLLKNHGAGASPDALVGDDGLLEIKTAEPHILLGYLDGDRVPANHMTQMQGQMWVSERSWCDLLIYWPAMEPLERRVERDDAFIDGTLAPAVLAFIDELEAMVERFSGPRAKPVALAAPAVDLATAPPVF